MGTLNSHSEPAQAPIYEEPTGSYILFYKEYNAEFVLFIFYIVHIQTLLKPNLMFHVL